MSRITDMTEELLGGPTAFTAGYRRTLTGLRTGDRTDLVLGLALLGFTYMRRTRPRKELIYSQVLAPGTHVTVRNAKPGTPTRLEIREPDPEL